MASKDKPFYGISFEIVIVEISKNYYNFLLKIKIIKKRCRIEFLRIDYIFDKIMLN
jgi:hypothetical protein